LKKYKDVMEAAEGVFGGEFDHIAGEEAAQMEGPSNSAEVKPAPQMTVQWDLVFGHFAVC
jgi:hypothetical protein